MKLKSKVLMGLTGITLGTMLALSGNSVYAETTNITSANGISAEISYYDTLITGKKNVVISVNMKKKNEITKEELIGLYAENEITNVKNKDGVDLADTGKVKTLDKVVTSDGEYTVILAGDANEDGIICDTDDIMAIINDYIGKNKITNEEKYAANLINSDDVLDIDDIMQMIYKYLGKVENLFNQGMPSGSSDNIKVNFSDTLVINIKREDHLSGVTYKLENSSYIYWKDYTGNYGGGFTDNAVREDGIGNKVSTTDSNGVATFMFPLSKNNRKMSMLGWYIYENNGEQVAGRIVINYNPQENKFEFGEDTQWGAGASTIKTSVTENNILIYDIEDK